MARHPKSDLDDTKRIMGALLRMPPKQHNDMKLSKGKQRKPVSTPAKKSFPSKR